MKKDNLDKATTDFFLRSMKLIYLIQVELLVSEDGARFLVDELVGQLVDMSSFRQLENRRKTIRQQLRWICFCLKSKNEKINEPECNEPI
jgi:hypothetical protein